MPDITPTWFIVVNPRSGSGKTIKEWAIAEILLEDKKIPYVHKMTRCKGHAIDIATQAAVQGYRHFVAVGGDGTAHEVLTGIMYYLEQDTEASLSDFYFAVIPIGSGNDWIRSHNIPRNTLSAVELISKGSFMGQDVVRINSLDVTDCASDPLNAPAKGSNSYMLNIGGVGFDSCVANAVNMLKEDGKRSKLLYFKSLLSILLKHKSYPSVIYADGEKIFEGPFLSVALGIGKYSGGGMRQCPYSELDDGLLDITIIPEKPVWWLLPKMLKVYSDKLPKVKGIISGKYRTVVIVNTSGEGEIVESDGEIVCRLPIRLETLPERINVVTNIR